MTEQERIEIYRQSIPKIEEIVEKKSQLQSNWIKNIITLMVALISVLVAFKSDKSEPKLIHFLFSQTLILLGVSVISGVILLYSEIDKLARNEEFLWESLRARLLGNNKLLSTLIKGKKIFVFFAWLFYISSIMSVISLICYGIMKDY